MAKVLDSVLTRVSLQIKVLLQFFFSSRIALKGREEKGREKKKGGGGLKPL